MMLDMLLIAQIRMAEVVITAGRVGILIMVIITIVITVTPKLGEGSRPGA